MAAPDAGCSITSQFSIIDGVKSVKLESPTSQLKYVAPNIVRGSSVEEWTIQFWERPTGWADNRHDYYHATFAGNLIDTALGEQAWWTLGRHNVASSQKRLYLSNSRIVLNHIANANVGAQIPDASGNQWRFIRITFEGKSPSFIRYSVNGLLIETIQIQAAHLRLKSPAVGFSSGIKIPEISYNDYYKGHIRDLRIYLGALPYTGYTPPPIGTY